MAFCAWCGNPVSEVSYAPCPRCGNPTNGSQRTAMPKGGTNTAGIVIGIVVGLFVLIAIVGILSAIAIPNMLTALQRSRQKRTMADLRNIAVSVESYATDKNQYPTAGSVAELQTILAPTYTKMLPQKDGWESEIRYECWPAGKCEQYALASAGADKKFEQSSLQEYGKNETTNFNADIVFANGTFVQYPQGIVTGGQR